MTGPRPKRPALSDAELRRHLRILAQSYRSGEPYVPRSPGVHALGQGLSAAEGVGGGLDFLFHQLPKAALSDILTAASKDQTSKVGELVGGAVKDAPRAVREWWRNFKAGEPKAVGTALLQAFQAAAPFASGASAVTGLPPKGYIPFNLEGDVPTYMRRHGGLGAAADRAMAGTPPLEQSGLAAPAESSVNPSRWKTTAAQDETFARHEERRAQLRTPPPGQPEYQAVLNGVREGMKGPGFTLEPNGRPFGGSGYLVADPALTVPLTSMNDAIQFLARDDVKAALAEGGKVAGWRDPKTGAGELNITHHVADRAEALKLGAERGQRSVGHITDGKYIGDIPVAGQSLADVRSDYRSKAGLTGEPLPPVLAVDEAAGRKMAQTYEGLKNEPRSPEVRAAYDAFTNETEAQAKHLRDAGYSWEFVDHDPYKTSKEMLKDLRENKHIKVLKTSGSQGHPLMTSEQNNTFRAVHEFLGHGVGEHSFSPKGEENAFREHAPAFTPLAQRALATETRGQNSWFNFGPHQGTPAPSRPFAIQKAALWPTEQLGDYPDVLKKSLPTSEAAVESPNVITPRRSSLLAPEAGRFTDADWAHIFGPGPFDPQTGAPALADLEHRFGRFEHRGSIIAPREPGSVLTGVPQTENWALRTPTSFAHHMRLREYARQALEHPLVQEDLERGVARGFHRWYNTEGTAQSAIDELGQAPGRAAHDELMGMYGPTSISTEPNTNFRLGGYRFFRSGNPEMPPWAPGFRPIYTNLVGAKMAELERYGGTNPMTGAKIAEYPEALRGNWAAGVFDRHHWRAAADYGFQGTRRVNGEVVNPGVAYEPWSIEFAKRMREFADEGILPVPEGRDPTAAGQAAIWGGAGPRTGVRGIANALPTFDDLFEQSVYRTGKHLGMSPQDVLSQFWRKKMPLY